MPSVLSLLPFGIRHGMFRLGQQVPWNSCHCHVRNVHIRKGDLMVAQEVHNALQNNKPVVALESTIITHGMPYPENVRTAQKVEAICRSQGAIPATVAIVNGCIHIGLTDNELEILGQGKHGAVKTSRRDLPYVLSQGLDGGTTVSATMIACHMAGIPIFVTGGIGGVHRGAETTMDISADLTELGRTPVAVVSAGVKSILDIGLTLEYLETQGVCVAAYGPSQDFPAFFAPKSGFKAPYSVGSPFQAAKLIDSNMSMGLRSGLLIAVPIPSDQAASAQEIEEAIQVAICETREKKVAGKEVTPYILQRVNELTEGRSLESNIALIENNAKVGSQIACELAKLRNNPMQLEPQSSSGQRPTFSCKHLSKVTPTKHNKPVVIGGTNVDFSATFQVDQVEPDGGTYPGIVQQSYGGVGRNLADCLSRLGCEPLFISAVGRDRHAEMFFHQCNHIDATGVKQVEDVSTACYCPVLTNIGELVYGIGDFQIHQQITPEYISQFEADLAAAPLVVMDGNISPAAMFYICDICQHHRVPVWFEPTDLRLVSRLFESDAKKWPTYVSPNMNELRSLHAHIQEQPFPVFEGSSPSGQLEATLEEGLELARGIIDSIPVLLITLGKHGVLLCRNTDISHSLPVRGTPIESSGELHAAHYPRLAPPSSIVSVSGAGDCLAAGVICGIVSGFSVDQCLRAGLKAAQLSLFSYEAVPNTITAEDITTEAQLHSTPGKPIMHSSL